MRQFLFSLLTLITFSSYGQHFGLRYSTNSYGISMSVPFKLKNAVTQGNISGSFMKEKDRMITYLHYTEKLNQFAKFISIKNLESYGGFGLHMGNRQVLSYKKDAYSIFLAGATAVLGIKYNVKKVAYVSVDVMPRVDFPFLGGCEMHKHCGEATIGNVNLSLGINLK